jgi:ketosteroid isomerase-like protein
MSDQIVEKFMDALKVLEETKDAEPLAALYSESAEVGNLLHPGKFQGIDGARQFWTEYRGTFDRAQSSFRNVIAAEGQVALEWTTRGLSFDGKPVRYEGVTILETDGAQITRSCAYFNPAALGEQIASE